MNMMEIITSQKKLHPHMKEQDIVKLLYQISYGPAHLLHDKISFYHNLVLEYNLSKLSPTPYYFREQLYENIDPDGKWVRLNLRKAEKYLKPEDIFYIVLYSIEEGDEKKFSALLEKLHLEKGILPFHHSEDYKKENPLYLIVKKEILFKILG